PRPPSPSHAYGAGPSPSPLKGGEGFANARQCRYVDALIAALAILAVCFTAWGALAQSPGNFSTLSTTGTATLNGDVLMCSGRPWIDVRCNGAVGDDSHDDRSAIQTTINTAIANNWPVFIPAGKYKLTSAVIADYASQAA